MLNATGVAMLAGGRGRGQGGVAIQPLVEVEKEAVHGLQRIAGCHRFLVVGFSAASIHQAERQHHQDQTCSHCPPQTCAVHSLVSPAQVPHTSLKYKHGFLGLSPPKMRSRLTAGRTLCQLGVRGPFA